MSGTGEDERLRCHQRMKKSCRMGRCVAMGSGRWEVFWRDEGVTGRGKKGEAGDERGRREMRRSEGGTVDR